MDRDLWYKVLSRDVFEMLTVKEAQTTAQQCQGLTRSSIGLKNYCVRQVQKLAYSSFDRISKSCTALPRLISELRSTTKTTSTACCATPKPVENSECEANNNTSSSSYGNSDSDGPTSSRNLMKKPGNLNIKPVNSAELQDCSSCEYSCARRRHSSLSRREYSETSVRQHPQYTAQSSTSTMKPTHQQSQRLECQNPQSYPQFDRMKRLRVQAGACSEEEYEENFQQEPSYGARDSSDALPRAALKQSGTHYPPGNQGSYSSHAFSGACCKDSADPTLPKRLCSVNCVCPSCGVDIDLVNQKAALLQMYTNVVNDLKDRLLKQAAKKRAGRCSPPHYVTRRDYGPIDRHPQSLPLASGSMYNTTRKAVNQASSYHRQQYYEVDDSRNYYRSHDHNGDYYHLPAPQSQYCPKRMPQHNDYVHPMHYYDYEN